jgi:hypothetical protein
MHRDSDQRPKSSSGLLQGAVARPDECWFHPNAYALHLVRPAKENDMVRRQSLGAVKKHRHWESRKARRWVLKLSLNSAEWPQA